MPLQLSYQQQCQTRQRQRAAIPLSSRANLAIPFAPKEPPVVRTERGPAASAMEYRSPAAMKLSRPALESAAMMTKMMARPVAIPWRNQVNLAIPFALKGPFAVRMDRGLAALEMAYHSPVAVKRLRLDLEKLVRWIARFAPEASSTAAITVPATSRAVRSAH
jgi:hypothetical protein